MFVVSSVNCRSTGDTSDYRVPVPLYLRSFWPNPVDQSTLAFAYVIRLIVGRDMGSRRANGILGITLNSKCAGPEMSFDTPGYTKGNQHHRTDLSNTQYAQLQQ